MFFKPLKKTVKVSVSVKAVAVKSVKKSRPSSRQEGSVLANAPTRRFTLKWWKCYLDSCATYHSFFTEEFVYDVKEGTSTLKGSCNAGTLYFN